MDSTIVQMLSTISLIAIGFLLRQSGVIHSDDGFGMARLIINVTLPSLIFISVSEANVSIHDLVLLGLCGAAVPLALRFIAGFLVRQWKLERPVAGVIVLGSMIINVGFFLFPFFQIAFGLEGVSRLAAFDVGQSLVANTVGYYAAITYGTGSKSDSRTPLKKVLTLPLVWACLLGLALNVAHQEIPSFIHLVLQPLSTANTPLAMLTLGSFIRLNFEDWKLMTLVVGMRMGVGWAVGQLLVLILGLGALERATVSLGAAMPVGMVVLLYSATEKLDAELAARAISLSILVALVLTPLLLKLYS